jgi:hypothetical protein
MVGRRPAMQMAAQTKVPGRETNVGRKGNFRELEQHNEEPQISSCRNQEIERMSSSFIGIELRPLENIREDKVRSDQDR